MPDTIGNIWCRSPVSKTVEPAKGTASFPAEPTSIPLHKFVIREASSKKHLCRLSISSIMCTLQSLRNCPCMLFVDSVEGRGSIRLQSNWRPYVLWAVTPPGNRDAATPVKLDTQTIRPNDRAYAMAQRVRWVFPLPARACTWLNKCTPAGGSGKGVPALSAANLALW